MILMKKGSGVSFRNIKKSKMGMFDLSWNIMYIFVHELFKFVMSFVCHTFSIYIMSGRETLFNSSYKTIYYAYLFSFQILLQFLVFV